MCEAIIPEKSKGLDSYEILGDKNVVGSINDVTYIRGLDTALALPWLS